MKGPRPTGAAVAATAVVSGLLLFCSPCVSLRADVKAELALARAEAEFRKWIDDPVFSRSATNRLITRFRSVARSADGPSGMVARCRVEFLEFYGVAEIKPSSPGDWPFAYNDSCKKLLPEFNRRLLARSPDPAASADPVSCRASDLLKGSLPPRVDRDRCRQPMIAATQGMLLLARRALKAGDGLRARTYLRRARALLPGAAAVHREGAIVCAVLGDFGEAIREIGWWRDNYGQESSEALEDAIRRARRAGRSRLAVNRSAVVCGWGHTACCTGRVCDAGHVCLDKKCIADEPRGRSGSRH